MLYYAELNYAEKGIKAKLREFFFLSYKTPNMLNYAEVSMFRAITPNLLMTISIVALKSGRDLISLDNRQRIEQIYIRSITSLGSI